MVLQKLRTSDPTPFGAKKSSQGWRCKRADVIVTQEWHEDVYVFVSKKHLKIPKLCQFFSTGGLLLLGWSSSRKSPFLISPLVRFNLLRYFSLFPDETIPIQTTLELLSVVQAQPSSCMSPSLQLVFPPFFFFFIIITFSFRGYPNSKRELGGFSYFSPLGTKVVKTELDSESEPAEIPIA